MHKECPLVSIVLPVYNGEKYLKLSIESCINQTYQNWELLIIDDCSSDATPEIAKKYESQDDRIRYYRNEKNLKLPGALNRGFSLTQGEYLTWTSDDNYYRPEALEKMVYALEHSSAEFVFTNYSIIDGEGKETERIEISNDFRHKIWGANIVGACFMYSRMVYEQIGDYDTSIFLAEDYDYWLRIFNRFEVMCVRENLYAYRLHDGALTATRLKEQHEALGSVLVKNVVPKKDMKMIDKCNLYRGLHRSRKYEKSFGKRYRYFIQAVLYEIWRRALYRSQD